MSRGAVGSALATLAGLGVVATGLVVIAPGESGVVRRFGRAEAEPWGPGLHLGWPLGIDRVDRLQTGRVRQVEIGPAGAGDEPGTGEYLTGDRNLIRVRAVVQYQVSDPVAFVLSAEDHDGAFRRLAESALARALARRPVDAALHEGRVAIAADVRSDLERGATRSGLGLVVLGVSLTETQPPPEVSADFAAAQAARSDLDKARVEARAYGEATRVGAEARGDAIEEAARAAASRAVVLAEARAARFGGLLAEAARSRSMTVRRLYLDGVRDLLTRVRRKVLLTPDEPIDMSLLGVGR